MEAVRQRANTRHRAKFRGDRSEGSIGTKMCHNAKFHGDRLNRCWDLAIFHDGGSAIFDFQMW